VQKDRERARLSTRLFETSSYATRTRQPPCDPESEKQENSSPAVNSRATQVVLTLALIGLSFLILLVAMLLLAPFR
jgi:hypothetical protein